MEDMLVLGRRKCTEEMHTWDAHKSVMEKAGMLCACNFSGCELLEITDCADGMHI